MTYNWRGAAFGDGGADEEVLRGDVGRETNETRRGVARGASRNVEAEALAIALLLGGFMLYGEW